MAQHYHTACGQKFYSDLLGSDRICPKCRKPFARYVQVSCKCTDPPHIYYSDEVLFVGLGGICPITGKPTVVTDAYEPSPPPRPRDGPAPDPDSVSSSQSDPGLVLLGIVIVGGYFIFRLLEWTWGPIQTALNALGIFIHNFFIAFVGLAKLLGLLTGMGVIGVGSAVIIYLLIRATFAKPIIDYDRMVDGFRVPSASPASSLPGATVRQVVPHPQTLPKGDVAFKKYILKQSGDTVFKQQALIFALLLGLVWGALLCIFSIKSIDQAKEFLWQVAQIGTINAILFAALYFALEFRLQMDKKLAAKTKWPRGTVIIALFGLASALTVVGLALVEGSVDTTQKAAISLAIDVTTSILVLFYGKLAEKGLHHRFA